MSVTRLPRTARRVVMVPDGIVVPTLHRSQRPIVVIQSTYCLEPEADFSVSHFLEEDMMRTSYGVSFLIAACSIPVVAITAFASELPKEGNYDFTACWSGVSNPISFSKDHTASSYEMIGVTRSNPPGGMFDKHTFRCVGMNASLGEKTRGPRCARPPMRMAISACRIFLLETMAR